jgi:hypothetical protein
MKAKEFITGKTLTAIETVGSKILNLVIDRTSYGLTVDTSTIKAGTKLKKTTSFEIVDDILTSGSMSVNLAETDMLAIFKQEDLIES